MNSFLFCGKNYDWYFTKWSKNSAQEILEDVELTREFNEQKLIDRDIDDLHGLFLQYV